MRLITKYSLLVLSLVIMLSACEKVDDLPFHVEGNAPVLTVSTTAVAPPVADSNKLVLTLNWTNPEFSTLPSNYKYVVQLDVAGNNFAHPLERVITKADSLSTDYIAKELNTFLLDKGYPFNVAVDVEARVMASYANNNDQKVSNKAALKITPYVVPPKVNPPASGALFLVGNSSLGGWNNPVPVLTQSFKKITELIYEGEFYLQTGDFLILPVNGSWDEKFAVENNSIEGIKQGGVFGYYSNASPTAYNSNFKGPDAAGLYKIGLDFQAGRFTITPVKEFGYLYMPGGYQSWSPETAPGIASPDKNNNYEGYANISAATEFKFTDAPNWSGTAYGDDGPGKISTSGGNLNLAAAGYYKINVNTTDLTWSATPVTWGLIGDFNGWSGDVAMTYDAAGKFFTATFTVPADGGFKIRANADWNINLGDNGANGTLEGGGDNIAITAGTHTIKVYLETPGYYWYEIQ